MPKVKILGNQVEKFKIKKFTFNKKSKSKLSKKGLFFNIGPQ